MINLQVMCPDSQATPGEEGEAGAHLTGAEEGVETTLQVTTMEDLCNTAMHVISRDIWFENAIPMRS